MNDPIICPVCGNEMYFALIGRFFTCAHNNHGFDGSYNGPSDDPDGSKVRAQIAAMEQHIHDSHPHTHPTGETLGEKGGKCPFCGMPLAEDNPNCCPACRSPHKRKTRGNNPITPATPPTCGQCAWMVQFVDDAFIYCRRQAWGSTHVDEGSICTISEILSDTPACPAFVERSEKS